MSSSEQLSDQAPHASSDEMSAEPRQPAPGSPTPDPASAPSTRALVPFSSRPWQFFSATAPPATISWRDVVARVGRGLTRRLDAAGEADDAFRRDLAAVRGTLFSGEPQPAPPAADVLAEVAEAARLAAALRGRYGAHRLVERISSTALACSWLTHVVQSLFEFVRLQDLERFTDQESPPLAALEAYSRAQIAASQRRSAQRDDVLRESLARCRSLEHQLAAARAGEVEITRQHEMLADLFDRRGASLDAARQRLVEADRQHEEGDYEMGDDGDFADDDLGDDDLCVAIPATQASASLPPAAPPRPAPLVINVDADDAADIKVIAEWPVPQSQKDLRRWLGLANYLHRYTANYAEMARPLSDLLKKDSEWVWTPECDRAFRTIAQSLQEAPILALPDDTRPFSVVCDASDYAIGCALLQEDEHGRERVISFQSRQLKGGCPLGELSPKLRAQLHRYHKRDGLLYYSGVVREDPRVVVPSYEGFKHRIVMMSLDLARQLGLKLRFDERLRVKGIGNVTTYVSAKATVKITLGASVVYYLEIWCGNIGEGIQCLLGMDFMIAAGVRLGAREGAVRLPDEERIPLASPGSRPALPLAALPDLVIDDKPADVSAADVGEADESTPEEVEQVRSILRKHQSVFLGSGNAVPPPARGVVCDIEVPAGTKPISQRARRIPGHLLEKVYELVKRLLEAGIVEYSDVEWASPVVIVMKKNGLDIRLCIDYRQVNQLITLMSYPLPLIDEMLDNFDKAMWFLSLDMASGFWAISMTQQDDWEDAVMRLLFAINTSVDATRRETPFFLMHGWDARSTVSAMLSPAPQGRDKLDAYVWRLRLAHVTTTLYRLFLVGLSFMQALAELRRRTTSSAHLVSTPSSKCLCSLNAHGCCEWQRCERRRRVGHTKSKLGFLNSHEFDERVNNMRQPGASVRCAPCALQQRISAELLPQPRVKPNRVSNCAEWVRGGRIRGVTVLPREEQSRIGCWEKR
ncbi:hypothetical protein P43SY_000690 [Pythium insidiosum]|uniref:Reverse transcriptase/retrotransposon-derived protein RNase H-like domain-containing protein n=1 Tax=Pythium insidiosum TaxID=114742 RepID=A0AAD5LT87_PYTIN|nr:hypothetical protein P43SY_000690 [Pythium insidiosum]